MRYVLLCLTFLLACAALAQNAADLTGTWVFVLDTEGGERRAEPTFQVDGTKVTGKWDSSDVKGTFENGKLELAFPMTSAEGGFSATLHITGKMDGGVLAGRWDFGEHSGTYKATRKPS